MNDLIDDAFAAFQSTQDSACRGDAEAIRQAFRAGWLAFDHTLRLALIAPEDDATVSAASADTA